MKACIEVIGEVVEVTTVICLKMTIGRLQKVLENFQVFFVYEGDYSQKHWQCL